MTGPGIQDDDDLTVESLQRKREELHDHGLGESILAEAVDEQIEDAEDDLEKRKRAVSAKVLLQQAEDAGLEDDPDVAALRAEVEDLSMEAEALEQDDEQDVDDDVKKRLKALEDMKRHAEQQDNPALVASYREKAEALKAQHGIEDDDSGRYGGETEAEALKKDQAKSALDEFRDRKETQVADENLPEDVKARLSQFKTMREQAQHSAIKQMYQNKIDDLRAEYSSENADEPGAS